MGKSAFGMGLSKINELHIAAEACVRRISAHPQKYNKYYTHLHLQSTQYINMSNVPLEKSSTAVMSQKDDAAPPAAHKGSQIFFWDTQPPASSTPPLPPSSSPPPSSHSQAQSPPALSLEANDPFTSFMSQNAYSTLSSEPSSPEEEVKSPETFYERLEDNMNGLNINADASGIISANTSLTLEIPQSSIKEQTPFMPSQQVFPQQHSPTSPQDYSQTPPSGPEFSPPLPTGGFFPPNTYAQKGSGTSSDTWQLDGDQRPAPRFLYGHNYPQMVTRTVQVNIEASPYSPSGTSTAETEHWHDPNFVNMQQQQQQHQFDAMFSMAARFPHQQLQGEPQANKNLNYSGNTDSNIASSSQPLSPTSVSPTSTSPFQFPPRAPQPSHAPKQTPLLSAEEESLHGAPGIFSSLKNPMSNTPGILPKFALPPRNSATTTHQQGPVGTYCTPADTSPTRRSRASSPKLKNSRPRKTKSPTMRSSSTSPTSGRQRRGQSLVRDALSRPNPEDMFINYTASDKDTINSSVAPSGSSRKRRKREEREKTLKAKASDPFQDRYPVKIDPALQYQQIHPHATHHVNPVANITHSFHPSSPDA